MFYILFSLLINAALTFCEVIESTIAATTALNELNYDVHPLKWEFFDISACEVAKTCWMQNADNPYGILRDTDNATNPKYDTDHSFGDYVDSAVMRVNQGDTIVILGCTPPEMRYFSITPYLFQRNDNEVPGDWRNLFGSIADSVNQMRMAAGPNNDGTVFNSQRFTVLLSTDTQASKVVEEVFKKNTPQQYAVNTIPLSASLFTDDDPKVTGNSTAQKRAKLKYGSGRWDDQFTFITRFAYPYDMDTWAKFVSLPYMFAYRIRPRTQLTPSPFPPPSLITRSQEASEDFLKDAFQYLVDALKTEVSKKYYTIFQPGNAASALRNFEWGGDCAISKDTPCLGDSRDTQYVATSHKDNPTEKKHIVYLLPRKSSIVLFAAIDHVSTNCSHYSSIVLGQATKQIGVASIAAHETSDTAAKYLNDTQYASVVSHFYVGAFAFDCTNIPWHCEVITTKGYQSITARDPFLILERAYVDPKTGIGQSQQETLSARAFVLSPKIFEE